jgi:hypothetical protein
LGADLSLRAPQMDGANLPLYPVHSGTLRDHDPRVCWTVKRDASGKIVRSTMSRYLFQKTYPCPSTGRATGACPGWNVDHVIPLACGGCDEVGNMQWLPVLIKSAPGSLPKDRWERKIYCERK